MGVAGCWTFLAAVLWLAPPVAGQSNGSPSAAGKSAAGQAAAPRKVTVRDLRQLAAALADAQPGDELLLAPGEYRGGLSSDRLQGSAEAPIVVGALDPENPPILKGGGAAFHIRRPQHLVLRDLVIDGAHGNGVNIDDGGSDEPASDVALRNLTIRNIGPRGNCDGLKLSGLVRFEVDNCQISAWGDGGSAIDMVGCRQGRIHDCTFADARGPGANGVQAKGGSEQITVSNCRFTDAGGRAVNIGGSTGKEFFRPAMQGYEAKNITVENCTFIGSAAPIAFVGVDGAVVRRNTIYRPTRWVVRILQENQDPSLAPCRNGRFEENLVVFHSQQLSTAVNVGPKTAPETFHFEGNAWHCLDRPENTRRLVQLPSAEKEGTYDATPRFVNAQAGDLRQTADSPLLSFGAGSKSNDGK